MELEEFVERLDTVRRMPSGISARCPAHDDMVASLMVRDGKGGGIVLKCHAGCSTKDILKAMGLTWRDVMGEPVCVATYDYHSESGEVLYSVERWANPKTFRCKPGLPPPAERVLYQLSAIQHARDNGMPVYVPEGEKDAQALCDLGIPATCNVGGADAWLPHYADQLAGCDVIVVADNDIAGRRHARAVAASLRDKATSVALAVPKYGCNDVSDLLDAGYTIDALDPLPESDSLPSFRASTVRVRRVRWLWPGYIPLGKLTLLEGDPGDGKSVLTLDLAARITRGLPMPDGAPNPFGQGMPVVLVSAEDDPEDTIVPRLAAAGADLDLCELVVSGLTPEQPFSLVDGLPSVEAMMIRLGVVAMIFDPLSAFLAAETDTHNDASTRRALYPLKAMAERTAAAGICVRHLNKGGSGVKAIYRGNGSIAFTGAARATFLVTVDRADPALRILAPIKTNLSARPPSLRYELASTDDGIPVLKWHGEADGIDAQMALDGPGAEPSDYVRDEQNSKLALRRLHVNFLLDVLRDGPLPWADIVAAGKVDGFSEHGLRRARADANLIKNIGPGGTREITWSLPSVSGSLDIEVIEPEHLPTCPLPEGPDVGPENAGQMGKWETIDGVATERPLTESELRARLDAAPNECDVCGSRDVLKFGKPHWAVRCMAHDPEESGASDHADA